MRETSAIEARLRAAATVADTLAAGFDAFEVIRLLARDCEDRVPGLLAAFMTAADAAVEGREAITGAPALPRPGPGARAGVPGARPDVAEIAGVLAALGALLRDCLSQAAVLAAGPEDQAACTDAAQAAGRICQLMARDDDDARLGEFLRPARAHIAAACFGGDLPDAAKRGAIAELDRLVATIARYLDDLALPADFTPTNVNPQQRTALDARLALHRAASSLHPAASAVRETTADYTHPAVGHLSSANGYLAAGRDLLRTHFTSGPAGALAGNSPWAAVITSESVTAALLSELAACSRQLATWTAQLSGPGSANGSLPAQGSVALQAASVWLRMAGAVIQTVQLRQPPPASGRSLLAAMPTGIPPPRRPPPGEEPVPDLCDGITITAGRLRHAVRALAAQGRWSPAAISASWRRDALASAITSHAGELILRTLAERARQLGTGLPIHDQLATSADALGLAWPAWRSIVRHWDTVSTGIHQGRDISPVAAELGDLVLRTGRLAYNNPRWTPACAHASPARDPADLAGTARDITNVLAAVHQAADAISRTADHDAQAVRQAAADHQLYMPTRLLPDHYDIPQRYTRVPPPLAGELLSAYDTVTTTSLHAAETLDKLAVTIDAPSSMLAAARIPPSSQVRPRRRPAQNRARQQPKSDPPASDSRPQPGQTELTLRSLQITEPVMLLRAAAVDEAARDLLARAAANSRQRNTINQPIPPGTGTGIRRAPRTAAQDLPLPAHQPANPAADVPAAAGRIETDSRAFRAQLGRGLTA